MVYDICAQGAIGVAGDWIFIDSNSRRKHSTARENVFSGRVEREYKKAVTADFLAEDFQLLHIGRKEIQLAQTIY